MATLIVDATPSLLHPDILDGPFATTLFPIDKPILPEEISPLVDQVHAGFRCADLLLRLPGAIPIPSFTKYPSLPSPDWVDVSTQSFIPEVVHHLKEPSSCPLHPSIPFPLVSQDRAKIPSPTRSIIQSPLLVRPPNPSVYTPEGRSQFLSSIGIPTFAHNPDKTRILIVSFGGQIFHAPRSRSPSPAPSRPGTPNHSPRRSERCKQAMLDRSPDRPHIPIAGLTLTDGALIRGIRLSPHRTKGKLTINTEEPAPKESTIIGSPATGVLTDLTNSPTRRNTTPYSQPPKASALRRRSDSQRIATDQHLWLPGAPSAVRKSEFASPITQYTPVFGATGSPIFPPVLPVVITTPPTPLTAVPQECDQNPVEYVCHPRCPGGLMNACRASTDLMEIPRLLPEDWIAVVCGASKERDEDTEHLPEGFYIAPKDVYMPDLIAVADVLLGKLVSPSLTFPFSMAHNLLTGVRKRVRGSRLSNPFCLRLQTSVHRRTWTASPP